MTEHERYKLRWEGIAAGLRVGYAGGVMFGIIGGWLGLGAIGAMGWLLIGLAILNLFIAWVEAKS